MISSFEPQKVGTDSDWKVISAGGSHTCGLKESGALMCWGANEYGQVGNGKTTIQGTPVKIQISLSNIGNKPLVDTNTFRGGDLFTH